MHVNLPRTALRHVAGIACSAYAVRVIATISYALYTGTTEPASQACELILKPCQLLLALTGL